MFHVLVFLTVYLDRGGPLALLPQGYVSSYVITSATSYHHQEATNLARYLSERRTKVIAVVEDDFLASKYECA